MDDGEALGERHADMILELERRGAGSPFGPVHQDELGMDPGLDHRLADAQKLGRSPNAQFEPGGLAPGHAAQVVDERQQLHRGRERGVVGRRHTFDAFRHAANGGDLCRDLGRRHDPTKTRLCPLGELDRNALDLIESRRFSKLVEVELSIGCAGSEVTGPDLPDQAPAVSVVLAEPALTGVVGKFALPGTLVQGHDRV